MLSILIPTYNYNIFPLVEQLQQQANNEGISFEIIVLDDASQNDAFIKENNRINTLKNCSYRVLPQNIGRSAIRNLLAQKAQYTWLLFLDADTLPVDSVLLKNYLPHLSNEAKVVYGGILYQQDRPAKTSILRWHYGNAREALAVAKRKENPYLSLLTLNFCIHKEVFTTVKFNESIPNLRHEDTLFSYNLMQHNIVVNHIANPVYHLGLESSEVFLQKSEEAVTGLQYLVNHQLIDPGYLKISGLHNRIKKAGLLPLAHFWHKATRGIWRKNLLGNRPSLLIFDLYRLAYMCMLK